jgi:hypothetical protein
MRVETIERFFVPGKEASFDFVPEMIEAPQGPLSLQVLFPGSLSLDSDQLNKALKAYHPTLPEKTFKVEGSQAQQSALFAIGKWGHHIVNLVGFNAPMPPYMVEMCLQSAPYSAALKNQVRGHQSHAVLYYKGRETDPLEQYIALATVAGAMADTGAMAILNESAHTSVPASTLSFKGAAGDKLALLHALPIPVLYSGFVQLAMADSPGVWMRTHGNYLLGLPDLATLAASQHEANEVLDVFAAVCRYLVRSKATLRAGHTMQAGPGVFIRLRTPRANEYLLHSEGEMLVVERILQSQINGAG